MASSQVRNVSRSRAADACRRCTDTVQSDDAPVTEFVSSAFDSPEVRRIPMRFGAPAKRFFHRATSIVDMRGAGSVWLRPTRAADSCVRSTNLDCIRVAARTCKADQSNQRVSRVVRFGASQRNASGSRCRYGHCSQLPEQPPPVGQLQRTQQYTIYARTHSAESSDSGGTSRRNASARRHDISDRRLRAVRRNRPGRADRSSGP